MKAFARTDRGMMRPSNQDSLYASTVPVGHMPNLFMVADGMGGHLAGDYASSYLVNHLVEEIDNSRDEECARIISGTIAGVNEEIYRLSSENAEYSGSQRSSTVPVSPRLFLRMMHSATFGVSVSLL